MSGHRRFEEADVEFGRTDRHPIREIDDSNELELGAEGSRNRKERKAKLSQGKE